MQMYHSTFHFNPSKKTGSKTYWFFACRNVQLTVFTAACFALVYERDNLCTRQRCFHWSNLMGSTQIQEHFFVLTVYEMWFIFAIVQIQKTTLFVKSYHIDINPQCCSLFKCSFTMIWCPIISSVFLIPTN